MLNRILIIGAVILASCGGGNSSPSAPSAKKMHENILGKWSVVSIMTDEFKKLSQSDFDSLMVKLIDNSHLEFNADSSFSGKMGPDLVKGKWSINPDGKHLLMGTDEKDEEVLEIVKLDKDSLILLNLTTTRPVTIKSVRLK